MNLRRGLFIAVLALAAAPAAAQMRPQAAPNPFDNPPAAAPNPFDNPPQQQEPPCISDFVKLRDISEKLGADVMAAQKRKAPLPEACKLLNALDASQVKLLTFAKTNEKSCGIPAQLIQQINTVHDKVVKARTGVCNMAATGGVPQRPSAPSLSDALSAPVTDSSNIKTGRGTFDTLTGTPLGNTGK